ncbi:hypothetical protein RD792_005240 [Penstemon davidsonii]|uniref:E3 ubiquitin protein ligase RIN2 n=1 Tax=Penstemon davidsonii TaxID=160366 RepID=A0ABR0DKQ9_9LAMI|nr:hypothetical protein RD792_005240 [Penstemon davidsonii]
MGVSFLSISAVCTVLSLVGLQYCTELSFGKYGSDGLIVDDFISSENASRALELLLGSYTSILLVASFAFNVFILIILGLKTVFFSELYTSEIRKMLERLANYVIYKGAFLPLVVPLSIFQVVLWSTWLAVLCFLKMFQALTRDRLERLNSSPSATPWTYFRVYSALLFVFSVDLLCALRRGYGAQGDALNAPFGNGHGDARRLGLASPRAKACASRAFNNYGWKQDERKPTISDSDCRRGKASTVFVQREPKPTFAISMNFWILLCMRVYNISNSSMSLLLFFEPSSIAFETVQAIVVHGFQLFEIWLHNSAGDGANCRLSKIFDISPAGSLGEWKGTIIRNLGFFLDVMTLLMALAHYLHIWWLHGMAFHLVDAVLFMNIRALLSAIVKRVKSFIKLRMALATLHGALPDATSEELRAYDDECAICREPMARAKKLSCNHLFHLACLRSWLDQGLSEGYSCPNCRKPLFTGRPENEANPSAVEISSDEQLARQMSTELDRPNLPGHNLHPGVLPDHPQNVEAGDWRRAGMDSSWLGLDGAGPSGFSRVQMVMRQLAAVGETYAQTGMDDSTWSLYPPNSEAGTSRSTIPPAGSIQYPSGAGSLRLRSTTHAMNDNLANIIAMAETVREVLPHIPEDIIFQDLQRTNSAMVTVNNLLQMRY